ncbi:MAG: DJ-1/PfpI family protein [Epsilonproteobacteria bacterium]|nr:DJ-1/PfpI family protein [Campylobacterota bacterium]
MASVLVPLATGFEEIEAVSIIDVLRRGGIQVTTASVESDQNVTGANGITIVANNQLDYVDPNEFDMLVLPGGHDGAVTFKESDKVQSMIKMFDVSKKPIGAICAAPMALAEAGVIKNSYTCYPSYEEGIGTEKFTDAHKVVVDENITTSRGPGTAICFALSIVKQLVGEETHNALKAGLIAEYC